jgi:MFS family permease
MYIAEVSPAEIRGRNVSKSTYIVFGILITNLVNYAIADTGENAWRWMFGLGAVPALAFLAGLFWLPESPRWLILQGKKTEGLAILHKIGGEDFALNTLNQVETSVQKTTTQVSIFTPQYLPLLFVGIGLAVFQQLCGINVVFNYTSTIFESVGADLIDSFETVSIGVVNVIFTILAMFLVDKIGRKPLMQVGSLGLAIAYILIAILLKTQAPALYLSIVVLLSISIYATTLAPVTWVLISEIFPNTIRGNATSFQSYAYGAPILFWYSPSLFWPKN